MKFDIKLLVRYYVRRNEAYGVLGLIDAAILRSNNFPSVVEPLAQAKEAIKAVIEECDKPFQGRRGEERTHLCRFLVDKLGSNSLDGVMDYINEIANSSESADS